MAPNESRICMSKRLWRKMIMELKVRGAGRRESGAFLLGREGSNEVEVFICFDDLDPNCLTGMIEFGASGFIKLWDYCEANKLRVIADVHTHPSSWTGQSVTDKQNPMLPIQGHIAMIIPNYAMNKRQLLKGVGVYEYLGAHRWKTHNTSTIKLLGWLQLLI